VISVTQSFYTASVAAPLIVHLPSFIAIRREFLWLNWVSYLSITCFFCDEKQGSLLLRRVLVGTVI